VQDHPEDESVSKPGELEIPYTVMLTRGRSMAGAIMPVNVILNGQIQERLKNGQTIEIKTGLAQNVLVSYENGKTNILRFEAQSGGNIHINLKYTSLKMTVKK
jgi:hypothetical protein